MNQEQLIQDYLVDRLSEKDKSKVEQLLKTDLGFKTELELHKDVAIAFKISEAKNLKDSLQIIENNIQGKKSSFNKYKYFYAAVASIFVIGLFFNIFNKTSGDKLFYSNFNTYPNTYQPVVRSSNSSNNKAFMAYENNNFLAAENEFKTLLSKVDNPIIRFYYASSLLNQSKFDIALHQFEMLNKQNHDYKVESLWYTALIQIKKENFSSAKETLERLTSINSVFKVNEVKALLQKLKKY